MLQHLWRHKLYCARILLAGTSGMRCRLHLVACVFFEGPRSGMRHSDNLASFRILCTVICYSCAWVIASSS